MDELQVDESHPNFTNIVSIKSQLDTFYEECNNTDTVNNCPTRQNLQLLVNCFQVMISEKGSRFCRLNTDGDFVISQFHVFVLERELNPTIGTERVWLSD
jgi:hypothetical protein